MNKLRTSDIKEIVTDEEVDEVWGNANFGSLSKRDVLRHGVLKVAGGFYQGYTSTKILEELGLKKVDDNELTLKGRRYLYFAWDEYGSEGV